MEGLTGIEPALSAWEAEVLPLNYSPVRPEARGKHNKLGDPAVAAQPRAGRISENVVVGVPSSSR